MLRNLVLVSAVGTMLLAACGDSEGVGTEEPGTEEAGTDEAGSEETDRETFGAGNLLRFRNQATGRFITSDQSFVRPAGWVNSPYQKYYSYGTYGIASAGNKLCWTRYNGSYVIQNYCNTNAACSWVFTCQPGDQPYCDLHNYDHYAYAKVGKTCMEDTGEGIVRMRTCNGSSGQRWRREYVSY